MHMLTTLVYFRCGPCVMVAPMFEQFVIEYPDVEFYKVDVDEAEDVAAHCGIQAMPTFQFYKGGEKIKEIRGADVNKIKELIVLHK
jgi:thioredoxin 1